MHHMGGVYRLYDKDEDFFLMLPKHNYLAICIEEEERFIQITCGDIAFNHYAAIKEMERRGLI
jgi:hypothetical protein